MEKKVTRVILTLVLVTSSNASDGSDWLSKPWSDHEPQAFQQLKHFEAMFDSFQNYLNPQHIASGSQRNSHVIEHPFRQVFPQQNNYYPGQNSQHHPPPAIFFPNYQNANQKQWNPQMYASKYQQGYHGPSQRYLVPKSNKQVPNNANLNNNKHIHSQDGPVPSNSYNRPPQVVNQPQKYQPYKANRANILNYQRDPLINKIKNDVNDNEERLREKETTIANGESEDIHDEQQHENYSPQYEIHNTQSQPNYYSPPQNQLINYDRVNKLKYPRPNTENIKIHPVAYYPLKNHIRKLKENQGQTFADERNQYPEVKPDDEVSEESESEGHDIFDNQKTMFDNQKSNFQDDLNDFTHEHHSQEKVLAKPAEYNDDRRNNDNDDEDSNEDGEKFIPVKMYAQVRHTETTRHLPQEAALEDAETYDEVLNAPRLREAIKTSKAQTVYTEEGYEDNAYDHAGHLKHASNHENHGGFAKNKNSGGDSNKGGGSHSYDDSGKSKHGHNVSKGKNWSLDEGKDSNYNNQKSFKHKNGNFYSNSRDLDGAGSEKLSAVPESIHIQESGSNKKHKMTKSVEKIYEGILEAPNTKESISDERRETVKKYLEKHRPITSTSSGFIRAEQAKNMLALRHVPQKYHGSESAQLTKKMFSPFKMVQANPDVEVFKQDLKATSGPRHGGNYQVHPTLFNYPKGKFSTVKILPKKHHGREYLNIKQLRYSEEPYRNTPEKLNPDNKDASEVQSLLSINPNVSQILIRPIPTVLPEKIYKDAIETLDEKPNKNQMFERLTHATKRDESRNVDGEAADLEKVRIANRNSAYQQNPETAELIPNPPELVSDKQDQFPITSEVEVFRSNFEMNKGPKHGGNYKGKSSGKKKKGRSESELEDLNGFQDDAEENLHGGNYRADEFEDSESNDDEVLPSSVVGSIAFLAANATSSPGSWQNS